MNHKRNVRRFRRLHGPSIYHAIIECAHFFWPRETDSKASFSFIPSLQTSAVNRTLTPMRISLLSLMQLEHWSAFTCFSESHSPPAPYLRRQRCECRAALSKNVLLPGAACGSQSVQRDVKKSQQASLAFLGNKFPKSGERARSRTKQENHQITASSREKSEFSVSARP